MFFQRRSFGSASSDQVRDRPMAIDHVLDHARNGEGEAISTLYHQFLPGVFGYIVSRTANRTIAEDLTSEVFLKMVEGIRRMKAQNEASFAAWLFQITRTTIADYYRKREKLPDLVSLEST